MKSPFADIINFYSSKNPTLEEFKNQVKKLKNINVQDDNRNTLLHYICKNDPLKYEYLDFLLEKGANPNLSNHNKNTPFHFFCSNNAATENCLELFFVGKNIFRYSADLKLKDDKGLSALHLICRQDEIDLALIKCLMKHAEKQKATDVILSLDFLGRSALHILCINPNIKNYVDALRYVASLACQFKPDNENLWPLHYAVMNKNFDKSLFELLMNECPEHCWKVDNNRQSILHKACEYFHHSEETLIFLFSKGKDFLDYQDVDSKTPLCYLLEQEEFNFNLWSSALKNFKKGGHDFLQYILYQLLQRHVLSKEIIDTGVLNLLITHKYRYISEYDSSGFNLYHLLCQHVGINQAIRFLCQDHRVTAYLMNGRITQDGKDRFSLQLLSMNKNIDFSTITLFIENFYIVREEVAYRDADNKNFLDYIFVNKNLWSSVRHEFKPTNEWKRCFNDWRYGLFSAHAAEEMIEDLLENNIIKINDVIYDRGRNSGTLLHYALYNNAKNKKDIVEFLIEKKADCNKKNTSGQMPLHIICSSSVHMNLEIIEFLVEAGSNVNAWNDFRHSALDSIFEHCGSTNDSIKLAVKAAEFLLRKGAAVDRLLENDHWNESLLVSGRLDSEKHYILQCFCAAPTLQEPIIQHLLLKSADPVKNIKGTTAIHIACQNEAINVRILKLLIAKAEGKLNLQDERGRTPFEVACLNEKITPEIKFYLQHENRDEHGMTEIHRICRSDIQASALYEKIIFGYRIFMDLKDKKEKTPLDYAFENPIDCQGNQKKSHCTWQQIYILGKLDLGENRAILLTFLLVLKRKEIVMKLKLPRPIKNFIFFKFLESSSENTSHNKDSLYLQKK